MLKWKEKKKQKIKRNKNYYLIYWTHRIQRNNRRKILSIIKPIFGRIIITIREQPILYSGYLIDRYKWLLKAALI